MLWLWIIAGLILLLLLLSRLRVGVRISLRETAAAWVTVGPIKIQVAPSKPSKNKERPKEKEKNPPEKKAKKRRAMPKPTLEDILSAAETLGPPMKGALRRTRRSIRIHPLQVSATVGGAHDPAEAAKWYGLLHAAVWTVMPVAEELLSIPEPGIHVGLDFDSPKTKVTGEIGISIRLGTITAVGCGIGIPALKWYLAWRKKRTPTDQPEKKAETEPAGGGTAA